MRKAFSIPTTPQFFCTHAAAKKFNEARVVERDRFKRAKLRLMILKVFSAHWSPLFTRTTRDDLCGKSWILFCNFGGSPLIGIRWTSANLFLRCTTMRCGTFRKHFPNFLKACPPSVAKMCPANARHAHAHTYASSRLWVGTAPSKGDGQNM